MVIQRIFGDFRGFRKVSGVSEDSRGVTTGRSIGISGGLKAFHGVPGATQKASESFNGVPGGFIEFHRCSRCVSGCLRGFRGFQQLSWELQEVTLCRFKNELENFKKFRGLFSRFKSVSESLRIILMGVQERYWAFQRCFLIPSETLLNPSNEMA